MDKTDNKKTQLFNYIILILSFFFATLSMTSLYTNMPLYIINIGGTELAAGLTTTIFTIFSVMIRPYIGRYVDKYGRIKVLVTSLFVFAVSIFLLSLTSSIIIIYLIRMVQGVGWGGFYMASYTIAADLSPEGKRLQYLGIFSAVPQVGMSLGPLAAALIASIYGYTYTFYITTFIAVISLLLSIFVKDTYQVPFISKIIADPGKKRISNMFPSVIILIITFCLGAVLTYVPLLGASRDIKNVSLFFTIFSLMVILTRPFSGKITEQIGNKTIMVSSLLSMMLSLPIIAFSYRIESLIFAAILFGLGFSLPFPILMSMSVELSPNNSTGTSMAAFTSAVDLGIGLGALMLGSILNYVGYTGIYLLASIFMLANLIYFIKITRTML